MLTVNSLALINVSKYLFENVCEQTVMTNKTTVFVPILLRK